MEMQKQMTFQNITPCPRDRLTRGGTTGIIHRIVRKRCQSGLKTYGDRIGGVAHIIFIHRLNGLTHKAIRGLVINTLRSIKGFIIHGGNRRQDKSGIRGIAVSP